MMNYSCDQERADVKCFQLNAVTDQFKSYSGIRFQASKQYSEVPIVQKTEVLVVKG